PWLLLIQIDQIAVSEFGEVEVHRSSLPVFPAKRRDASEFARVVRHQRQVVSKGDRSDQEVMRSDRFSLSFERTTDLSAFPGASVTEREGREWRKEDIELRVLTGRIGTWLGAVAQFVHDDRTQSDVGYLRR